MKQSLLLFFFLLQITTFTFGQLNHNVKTKSVKEYNFDVGAIQTSIMAKNFYGVNFNLKYFPTKRIGTGAYIIFSQRNISDTFTYSIQKPIIQFYEIGWTNQYSFLHTSKLRMSISLVNGFSQARLGDNAIKEKRHKYAPKEISSNFFYSLEPGSSFSCKLISIGDNANLWLTAAANYRFVFGNTKYGMTKDFSGYLFSVGISIIGFDDDKDDRKE
jgi:hypothetical protein